MKRFISYMMRRPGRVMRLWNAYRWNEKKYFLQALWAGDWKY